MNRVGSRAFFLSRSRLAKLATTDGSSSSDEETYATTTAAKPCHHSSLSASTDSPLTKSNSRAPPAPGHLDTSRSRLPDPSIRVSYSQLLQSSNSTTTSTSSPMDTTDDEDAATTSGSSTRIRFQPLVSVVEIPSRKCYSLVQRESLWRSSKEIRYMARRNRKEYSHDGCNWRTATEEPDMIHLGNGDYMHPHSYRCVVGGDDDDSLSDEEATTMSSRELEAKYETSLPKPKKKGLKTAPAVKKRPVMWQQ